MFILAKNPLPPSFPWLIGFLYSDSSLMSQKSIWSTLKPSLALADEINSRYSSIFFFTPIPDKLDVLLFWMSQGCKGYWLWCPPSLSQQREKAGDSSWSGIGRATMQEIFTAVFMVITMATVGTKTTNPLTSLLPNAKPTLKNLPPHSIQNILSQAVGVWLGDY